MQALKRQTIKVFCRDGICVYIGTPYMVNQALR